MRETAMELGVELTQILLYLIAAAFAGTLGFFFEYNSYIYAMAGQYRMAGWLALLGAVGLFFGISILYRKIGTALGIVSSQ